MQWDFRERHLLVELLGDNLFWLEIKLEASQQLSKRESQNQDTLMLNTLLAPASFVQRDQDPDSTTFPSPSPSLYVRYGIEFNFG